VWGEKTRRPRRWGTGRGVAVSGAMSGSSLGQAVLFTGFPSTEFCRCLRTGGSRARGARGRKAVPLRRTDRKWQVISLSPRSPFSFPCSALFASRARAIEAGRPRRPSLSDGGSGAARERGPARRAGRAIRIHGIVWRENVGMVVQTPRTRLGHLSVKLTVAGAADLSFDRSIWTVSRIGHSPLLSAGISTKWRWGTASSDRWMRPACPRQA